LGLLLIDLTPTILAGHLVHEDRGEHRTGRTPHQLHHGQVQIGGHPSMEFIGNLIVWCEAHRKQEHPDIAHEE
jgi:hypothetical protein